MKQTITRTIILLAAVALLGACAAKRPPSKTGETWLREGTALFEAEEYNKATEHFEQAIRNAEDPDVAGLAQWYLGLSYYRMEKYDEAIPSFTLFLDLYPSSSLRPEALQRLAKSYEAQVFAVSRDQTNTLTAISYYQTLIDEYPDAAIAMNAADKVAELRERLGAKEVYVAKFYLRVKKNAAAVDRFEYAIEHYADTDAYAEAIYLLAEHLTEQDDPSPENIERARELYRLLRTTRPNSEYRARMDNLFKNAGIASGV